MTMSPFDESPFSDRPHVGRAACLAVTCLCSLLAGDRSRTIAADGDPVARVIIDDPLTSEDHTTAVSGGSFGRNGWKANEQTDHLRYELPEDVSSGSVEFEVKGIRTGAEGDARKHVFMLADRDLGPDARYTAENGTVMMLRIWTKDRETSRSGKTRLRTSGLGYGPPEAAGSKFQADSEPLEWNPDRWHKFRIAWTQTEAVFERDDVEVSRLSYPDRDVPYRQVFVNAGRYGPDMFGLSDVVFRNVKIRAR